MNAPLLSALLLMWGSDLMAQTECARTPVEPMPARRPVAPEYALAARVVRMAYPGVELLVDGDQTLVVERGRAYKVLLNFEQHERLGMAALALTYESQIAASVVSAGRMDGSACKAPIELVVARVASGAPTILARGPMDAEALAVDVRTLTIRDNVDGPSVYAFNRAYYSARGWRGNVMWRATYAVEGRSLVVDRLPATYVKRSTPGPHEMTGYLAPAGATARTLQLQYAAMGTKGEQNGVVEFPLGPADWISGVEILRRVP